MSIGAFARASHLSARALRLYDSLGLLTPAQVDPATGYRGYEPDQLDRARWIARLRELELPLEEIAVLLELDARPRASRLREHGTRLRRTGAARQALVEHLAAGLEGNRRHSMDVQTRELPARRLLTCAKRVTAEQVEPFATALFARFAGEHHPARPEGIAGAPFLRYHGELGPDTDALVEFCCPLTEDAHPDTHPDTHPGDDAGGLIEIVREDARRYAWVDVTARDSYSSLPFEVLDQWVTDNHVSARWLPEQIIVADARTAADDEVVYQVAVPIG